MTRILIAGKEHFSEAEKHAFIMAGMRSGADTLTFAPTNRPTFNWGHFATSLKQCSHLILVLKGDLDMSHLVINARAGVLPLKVAMLCLDTKALERHLWLIEEGYLDLVIVTSPLDHSKVRCSHSLSVSDIAGGAADILNRFIAKMEMAA